MLKRRTRRAGHTCTVNEVAPPPLALAFKPSGRLLLVLRLQDCLDVRNVGLPLPIRDARRILGLVERKRERKE